MKTSASRCLGRFGNEILMKYPGDNCDHLAEVVTTIMSRVMLRIADRASRESAVLYSTVSNPGLRVAVFDKAIFRPETRPMKWAPAESRPGLSIALATLSPWRYRTAHSPYAYLKPGDIIYLGIEAGHSTFYADQAQPLSRRHQYSRRCRVFSELLRRVAI